jgi:hypothetical protein
MEPGVGRSGGKYSQTKAPLAYQQIVNATGKVSR